MCSQTTHESLTKVGSLKPIDDILMQKISDIISGFSNRSYNMSHYDKIHTLMSLLEINNIHVLYCIEDAKIEFRNIETDSPYDWKYVRIDDISLYNHLHDILHQYCQTESTSFQHLIYADSLNNPPWEAEHGILRFYRKESYPSYDVAMSKKIEYTERYRDIVCHVKNKYIHKEDQHLLLDSFILNSQSVLDLYMLSVEDDQFTRHVADRLIGNVELKERIYNQASLLKIADVLVKYIKKAHPYTVNYIRQHIAGKKEYESFCTYDSHVTINVKQYRQQYKLDIAYHILIKYKQYPGQPKPRKISIQYQEHKATTNN